MQLQHEAIQHPLIYTLPSLLTLLQATVCQRPSLTPSSRVAIQTSPAWNSDDAGIIPEPCSFHPSRNAANAL
ncbi:uncharacterized protein BDV14DRAFT_165376 [Aspergillus stella-maris]|uniref:uncharacterized protein n=1 Tax=Aspergillus stella-maris TaxID=1810926 RepID=UPI003CCCE247